MPVLKIGAAALLAAGALLLPHSATAQFSGLAQILEEPSRLLHSSTPGYMGVLVSDVDSDFASKNRLKEVRGAAVTLIDHDAPAAQAGIRVNDVILQVNGQQVDNAETFTRMLRELPAGHTVSLLISRDGNTQTIAVELCDRKKMEHDVWNKLDQGADSGQASPTMGILGSGGGDVPSSPGFHLPFFNSTLNVGAIVEPLAPQMADYLGVQSGLMIKQVTRKSEAEAAGLRAFDVILKVGNENIATSADWDRALRANQNKPVAVTILRDRKQQIVTLQVDSKRHRSELEDLFPDVDCPLAALDPEAATELAQQTFSVSPEQAEQFEKHLRQQAQRLQQELNDKNFKLDQQELDQLKQRMQQFRQNLKPEAFKFDKKQLDKLNEQIQQFNSPDFNQRMRDQMKVRIQQLKRQLEEMQVQGFDHMV